MKSHNFKTIVIVFLYILMSPVSVIAGTGDNAKKYVNGVSDRVLAVIKTKSSDADKEKQLTQILEESVDASWMGRFAMGRYYRQASQTQQDKYLKLYREFLIQSYVPRFKEYAGEEFKIVGVKDMGDGQYIVETELQGGSPEAQPIKVDYRLKEGNSFHIIDVVGEGVSLITTQRSDFGGMISQKGVDYFLEKLEEKVKGLRK